MSAADELTTVVSNDGRITLPEAILRRRRWAPGSRLTVEETPDGVLLRAPPLFAETVPGEVYGSLANSGPAKSIEEMDAGVEAEAKRPPAPDRS